AADGAVDEEPSHWLFVWCGGEWFGAATAGFRGRRVLGGDDGARLQSLRAFNDYAVSWLKSFFHDPQRSHARADGHGFDRELVVGSDNRHVVEALQFLDCPLRHEHGVLFRFENEAHAPVLAWPNQGVRVGEPELQRQRSRRGINGTLDRIEPAFLRVYAAIGEQQFHRHGLAATLPTELVGTSREAQIFRFADTGGEQDRIDLRHRGQQRAFSAADKSPWPDQRSTDESIDRRGHRGITQIEFGFVYGGVLG